MVLAWNMCGALILGGNMGMPGMNLKASGTNIGIGDIIGTGVMG
jgi:hypothetical protein